MFQKVQYPTFFRERDGLVDRLAALDGMVHAPHRGPCTISNRMRIAFRVPEISREQTRKSAAPKHFSYGRTPTMRTMDWKWHGCVSGTGLGMMLRPSATALVR